MKYLGGRHLRRLEELKKEEFLLESIQKLDRLSLPDTFPREREEYFDFADHIYKVAHSYGLRDKDAIFAMMLAWHLEGDAICQDSGFVSILNDKNISQSEKRERLEELVCTLVLEREKESRG